MINRKNFPNGFVTYFDKSLLEKYQLSIDNYSKIVPNHKLSISKSINFEIDGQYILYNHGNWNISEFWNYHRSLDKK